MTCIEQCSFFCVFFRCFISYLEMGRFQSCKGVVERALRRAFYDGVLELYEGSLSERVTCVALEGSLALTINRSETLVIKLNEVAQRADEISDDVPEGRHPDENRPNIHKRKLLEQNSEHKPEKRLIVKLEVKEENSEPEKSSAFLSSSLTSEPKSIDISSSGKNHSTSDKELFQSSEQCPGSNTITTDGSGCKSLLQEQNISLVTQDYIPQTFVEENNVLGARPDVDNHSQLVSVSPENSMYGDDVIHNESQSRQKKKGIAHLFHTSLAMLH